MEMGLLRCISGVFRKEDATYSLLRGILGFRPGDQELYRLALTHRSAINERDHGRRLNNERLEFLGDSVLGTIMADILYRRFPESAEGELTNFRSRLVKRETLDQLALTMGLDRLVITTRHTPRGKGGPRVHINGNAFEALVGAVYLDKGYRQAYRFVESLFGRGFLNMETAVRETNYKSLLIEWAQQNKYEYVFKLTGSEANHKDNTTTFHTQALIEGKAWGEGQGLSKKQSEQDAARHAMEALRGADFRITPASGPQPTPN